MNLYFEDFLKHYGTPQMFDLDPRGSGRYRQGSGDKSYQHAKSMLQRIREYEDSGLSAKEIKDITGLSSGDVRALKSAVKNRKRQDDIYNCIKLKDKGMSTRAISLQTGLPESTVRNYLKPETQRRANERNELAEALKAEVDKKKYLDVGKGVELQLGISRDKLNKVVKELENDGYKVQYLRPEQATNPDKKTSVKVLTKDDVPWKELNQNRDKVQTILDIYRDDGVIKKKEPPVSIDSSRIKVRYAEDGGDHKDGVIELKPGVADISLGNARYSQVRIAVDDTHYLKGMAMYADGRSFPKGCDIIFNTNKHKGTPLINPDDPDHQVLKPLKTVGDTNKIDVDNPFGAIVRQKTYTDSNGKEHLSPVNIVNDDTDWDKWSKNLSSQFLSKQWVSTARKQLDITYDQKVKEYEELSRLTNPVLKEKLLYSFAGDCDSAAVHLKAAAFPRQATHVILPMPHLKETEIYAPNYDNGEQVALIRYPHGGTFEIPVLKVNNNDPKAKKLLGNAEHAVGIHYKVAEQLSGADFDGDTVVVIPMGGNKIKATKAIQGLATYDTKAAFPAYEGMPRVGPKTGFHKQQEMGKVSNLITDMTIKGANQDEIARAVRHSMVVIDAEKHNLDWRASEEKEGIKDLKRKYQGVASNGQPKGAATIISRAKGDARVPYRDPDRPFTIDPETGRRVWNETGEGHWITKKDGTQVWKPRKVKTTKMDATEDAYTLTSDGKGGEPIEKLYADHANRLKALGNRARRDTLYIESIPYDKEARKIYKKEVESLQQKLNDAVSHSPKERKAQLVASKVIEAKRKANPDMTKEEEKKMRSIAIADARSHLLGGTSKKRITEITDREWEAIQSGAVTKSMLREIIDNADTDMVKRRATPRDTASSKAMSAAKIAQARAMLANGYTQAEVAKRFGVSASTISKAVKKKGDDG